MTRRAADGELDPVFCREKELDRMVEILCRRQKNNPCLVGEPGVGKTALAEGLAQRIADKQVPRMLQGRRLLALDMASLVLVRSTAATLKSGSRTCWKNSSGTAAPSSSWMSSTPSSAPVRQRGLSTQPAS